MATQDEAQDEVRLAVPATPEFVRLARVTASGLASRMGFSFDDVEDLRLAIDELCFALIGSKGRAGTVRLRYAMHADLLEVVGTGDFDGAGTEPVLAAFSRQILGALVDDYAVYLDDDGHGAFRLAKHRA